MRPPQARGRHGQRGLAPRRHQGLLQLRRLPRRLPGPGRALRRGSCLLRYETPDDFGAPATAFNICTFWYVDALGAIGRKEEARELFDAMLSRRNALGLLSEDLDFQTGELWGNFPQTYSLVGLINAAMRLSRRWEEVV